MRNCENTTFVGVILVLEMHLRRWNPGTKLLASASNNKKTTSEPGSGDQTVKGENGVVDLGARIWASDGER